MKELSDDLKSSLTAAKLKALCILNDLPTSGNKANLVERLLDSGLPREELGLDITLVEDLVIEPELVEAEIPEATLSLEDEDTLTPEVEPVQSKKEIKKQTPDEETVLEAEVLDAEFVSLEEEVKAPKEVPKKVATTSKQNPATILDMVKQPKVAALFIVVVILGAGTWYYFNNQLEPFTADTLRYGDEMTYTISDGDFSVTEEFLDLFLDQIDTDEDLCKIAFSNSQGIGELKVIDGGSDQLTSQTSLDRIGAVNVRGGMGSSWLSVESQASYDFSREGDLTIEYSYLMPVLQSCEVAGTLKPKVELDSNKWTELKSRNTLANEVSWDLNAAFDGEFKDYEGNLMTFGVGGLFGDIDTISPGFSMLLQPVELQELLATDYIDDGAAGSRLGWDWRVLGTETLGSTEMWKIIATNQDIQDYCLGSASMTLLVEEGNPWATKQEVNVVISGSESNREGCSTTSKLLGDYILPEGELTMSHTFQKSTLNRGSKSLEYGLSYDARPQGNELSPSESELNNWGPNGEYMPDDSEIRTHNLEAAMQCFDYFQSSAPGAVAALDNNGYIWRALNQNFEPATQWNVSWIASDDTAGWVTFNLTGTPSQENCEFDKRGSYDESVSYNREFIPKVLNLSTIESDLLDSNRFPPLSSNDGVFTTSGAYHPETRIGYLVVVPGSGINTILSNIGDATDGATTVDVSREWTDDGWDKRFNLVVDATDGRIIGWNYVSNT